MANAVSECGQFVEFEVYETPSGELFRHEYEAAALCRDPHVIAGIPILWDRQDIDGSGHELKQQFPDQDKRSQVVRWILSEIGAYQKAQA